MLRPANARIATFAVSMVVTTARMTPARIASATMTVASARSATFIAGSYLE
jgi:hypothetical protein